VGGRAERVGHPEGADAARDGVFGGGALTDGKQKVNQALQVAQFKKDTDRLVREGKITAALAEQGVAWAEAASYADLSAERERVERKYFGQVTPVPEFSYR